MPSRFACKMLLPASTLLLLLPAACDRSQPAARSSGGSAAQAARPSAEPRPAPASDVVVSPQPVQPSHHQPPLRPEPFDSTGCSVFKATYRPDGNRPDTDLPFRYALRFQPNPHRWYEPFLIFEARDHRSGALVTTLRLQETTSVGFANQYAGSTSGSIGPQMQELNRDLTWGTTGRREARQRLAPYALLFTDLSRDLHYLHGDWKALAPDVTYHTPQKATPLFPSLWVIADCGSDQRSGA